MTGALDVRGKLGAHTHRILCLGNMVFSHSSLHPFLLPSPIHHAIYMVTLPTPVGHLPCLGRTSAALPVVGTACLSITILYRFRHLPVSIYPLGKVTLDRLAESFESSQPFPDTVYNKDMGTRAWLYVGGPLASVPRVCSQGWSLIMLDEHPTVHGSHLPLMQSPSDLTAWHLSECHLPCDSQGL